MTEGGETVYAQPEDDWIRVPFPPLVDEQTWDRAQAVKRQRKQRSRRNTKIFYLLQHLVTCAECGRLFACRSTTGRTVKHKGKRYRYDLETPHRHYQCYGMLRERLRCRERPLIKADQLEELVWGEVKRMIRNPELIAAGIEALDTRDEDGLDRRIARAEADLRKVQTEGGEGHQAVRVREDHRGPARPAAQVHSGTAGSRTGKAGRPPRQGSRWPPRSGSSWRTSSSGPESSARGWTTCPMRSVGTSCGLLVDQVLVDSDNNVNITLGIPTEDFVSIEKGESPCLCRTTVF